MGEVVYHVLSEDIKYVLAGARKIFYIFEEATTLWKTCQEGHVKYLFGKTISFFKEIAAAIGDRNQSMADFVKVAIHETLLKNKKLSGVLAFCYELFSDVEFKAKQDSKRHLLAVKMVL